MCYDTSRAGNDLDMHVTNPHLQVKTAEGRRDWGTFLRPWTDIIASLETEQGAVTEGEAQDTFSYIVRQHVKTLVQYLHANKATFSKGQAPLDGPWRSPKTKGAMHSCGKIDHTAATSPRGTGHRFYGFDMVLTRDKRWWVLDVNHNPAWRTMPDWQHQQYYEATVEAMEILAQGLGGGDRCRRSATRGQDGWADVTERMQSAGRLTNWAEVYNEARDPDNPSPFLRDGGCAVEKKHGRAE